MDGSRVNLLDWLIWRNLSNGGQRWSAEELASRKAPRGPIILNDTNIYPYAFQFTPITSLRVYNDLNTVYNRCFDQCKSLRWVDWHQAGPISGQYCMSGCTAMEWATLDVGGNLGASIMADCSILAIVELGPNVSAITANDFASCAALRTIILRRANSITSLSATNAFNMTPFASNGDGGNVYIPKTLFDHLGDGTAQDYLAATNWSSLTKIKWQQIEGSQYDGIWLKDIML